MGFDLLHGFGVFDGKLGALGKSLGKDDHGAAGADSVGEAIDRLGSARQMDENRHAKKDTLCAAPFFVGLRANGVRTALDLWSGRSRGRV